MGALTRATSRIGQFRLLERIHRDERLDTWLVTTPWPDHPVAILRRLRSAHAKDGAPRERFLRRTTDATGLRHPRLLEVLDADVSAGFPYVVSVRPPGRSVDTILRRLRRRRCGAPPMVICSILRDMLRALVAVHDEGVAHGDLRPKSISIDDYGFAKVAPIGIWASGRGDDLFDVGTIALALITGGNAAAEGLQDLRRLRPDLPRWLMNLVYALVASDLRERPTSAAEVLETIEQHSKRDGWLHGNTCVVHFLDHLDARPSATKPSVPEPPVSRRGRTVVSHPVLLPRIPGQFYNEVVSLIRGYAPLMAAAILTGVAIGAALT